MHDHFRQHVESLHPSLEALLRSDSFTLSSLPHCLPEAGIYLFTDAEKHLYVGRSNTMRKRLQQHCRASSSHNSAPFAFRLAREDRNILKATYKKEGSRAHLTHDPEFSAAFSTAKSRLRTLQIRVVEESNPVRQALLEIYIAVSLEAPYNNFNNH